MLQVSQNRREECDREYKERKRLLDQEEDDAAPVVDAEKVKQGVHLLSEVNKPLQKGDSSLSSSSGQPSKATTVKKQKKE